MLSFYKILVILRGFFDKAPSSLLNAPVGCVLKTMGNGDTLMKKLMNLALVATVSAFAFTGCSNMSASEQRVGAAALGGALGGGVGSNIGGSAGAALGAGAGAAVGSKSQNGSTKNATYSGVGAGVGAIIGKSVFGGSTGAAIGGAIGAGAGAALENNNR